VSDERVQISLLLLPLSVLPTRVQAVAQLLLLVVELPDLLFDARHPLEPRQADALVPEMVPAHGVAPLAREVARQRQRKIYGGPSELVTLQVSPGQLFLLGLEPQRFLRVVEPGVVVAVLLHGRPEVPSHLPVVNPRLRPRDQVGLLPRGVGLSSALGLMLAQSVEADSFLLGSSHNRLNSLLQHARGEAEEPEPSGSNPVVGNDGADQSMLLLDKEHASAD
jgi:hypothetical protein